MSSVSAACIFGAYNASSAHTDTFYIVSQIVRVRNSKRHFFSKLTLPYIIQQLCFHPTATSTTAAPLHPTATSTTATPPHPTVALTTTAPLHPTATSTTATPPHPTATLTTAAPLHPTATSTTAALLHPAATSTTAAPLHPTATSTTTTLLHPTATSTTATPPHPTATSTTTASLHPTVVSTTTAPLHPTATSTTARHFAQQSRLNSSAENFSYFFKKALDKYPKTVYNVYCYLGVAQIGSALPWGGRGRRFKSCHSDQLKTA